MVQKTQVKLDTDVRIKIGLTVGMISAFFVGVAFLGLLSTVIREVETKPSVVESPPVVESVELGSIIAITVETPDPKNVPAVKEAIEAYAENRVYAIFSQIGNVDGTTHLLVGNFSDDAEMALKNIPSVKHLFRQKELVDKSLDIAAYTEDERQLLANFVQTIQYPSQPADVEEEPQVLGNDSFSFDEYYTNAVQGIEQDEMLTEEKKTEYLETMENLKNSKTNDEPDKAGGPVDNPDIGLNGLIAVYGIWPESDGDAENWTDEKFNETRAAFEHAYLVLAASAPKEKNLSFWVMVSPPDHEVNGQYINHIPQEPSLVGDYTHDKEWMHNLMRNRNVCWMDDGLFGICLDDLIDWGYLYEIDVFNEAVSSYYGVPQAFTVFIPNNENNPPSYEPPDSTWPHAYRGYFTVVGSSWSRPVNTHIHESLHVFYASDQYAREDSTGCNASEELAWLRVREAGEENFYTNRNDVICDDYQKSVMKSSWSYKPDPDYIEWQKGAWIDQIEIPIFDDYDLGTPIFDWHAQAQINWGDIGIVKINWNSSSSTPAYNNAMVWIDGGIPIRKQTIEYSIPVTPHIHPMYIPIAPGTHNLKVELTDSYEILSPRTEIQTVVIPSTSGPGPTNGVTEITLSLDYVPDIECYSDSECPDIYPCSAPVCINDGTTSSECVSVPDPAICNNGQQLCGYDAAGCNCGICGASSGCVSGQCVTGVCDGGIPVGQCQGETLFCNSNYEIELKDCRTCGCTGAAECVYDPYGYYRCKVPTPGDDCASKRPAPGVGWDPCTGAVY